MLSLLSTRHLSSSCFLHSPSPCSSLFFSLSLTLKALQEFQLDGVMPSVPLRLFIFPSPNFSLSHKKTSFSLSEPLCWPPPCFPPLLHLFPPTFNGSLTSIFTVSCCSGQHLFFNYTPLWMVLTKISSHFHRFTIHLQSKNIVRHPNYFGYVNAIITGPLTVLSCHPPSLKPK